MLDDQHLSELHLHLDGSLSTETVRYLAEQQGITLPGAETYTYTDEELKKLLAVSPDCSDLNEYLDKFELPLSLLQTEEAISYAVRSIGLTEESLGVDYAEIRFAPQLHTKKGLTQREVIEAAADAAVYFNADHDTKLRLILCCMRGADNHEENLETVRLAAEFIHPVQSISLLNTEKDELEEELAVDPVSGETVYTDSLSGDDLHDDNTGAASKMVYIPHADDRLLPVIAGIDLAGAEALYPTEGFADIFSLAAELNVPFTIHAGEAAGPESILAAINMGAKRIGHGVAAIKDEALMKLISEKGIVLECCPTSNLNTRVADSYEELPVREFLKRGIRVTISTDNMTVSDTDIIKEFDHLTKAGLTEAEKQQLLKNAENGWL